MIITCFNALVSISNIIYGNSLSFTSLIVSLLGFYGAKTLNGCFLFTYLMFSLFSFIMQAILIPNIIDKYNQDTWVLYCIGIGIDLLLLIYVAFFYRTLSIFRYRMGELRTRIGLRIV